MMNSITRSLNIVPILRRKQRSNISFIDKKIVFDLCFLSKLQLCLSFWWNCSSLNKCSLMYFFLAWVFLLIWPVLHWAFIFNIINISCKQFLTCNWVLRHKIATRTGITIKNVSNNILIWIILKVEKFCNSCREFEKIDSSNQGTG